VHVFLSHLQGTSQLLGVVTLLRIFTGESKGSFAQGLFSRNLYTAAASCQKRRFQKVSQP
jgi:hypothetical protein